MKWRIIADSSCDIFKMDECADPALNREAADSIYFSTVPFLCKDLHNKGYDKKSVM